MDRTPMANYTKGLVLAHGCFDLLHLGHVRYLEEARNLGDRLVVSVTSDRYASKAPGRPAFTAAQRAEMLGALKCVDEVIINDYPTAVPVIERLRPEFYVKGPDYAGA
jgi:rfaE bifunctional protein nucleotidyltransferase chain/domain